MEYAIGIGIGLAIGVIVGMVVGKLLATKAVGGPAGFELSRQIANKSAADATFAKKLNDLLNPPPPKPSGEPIRLLALLQREARLLDFLMENIAPYSDDQIGASVKDIHAKAQSALKKHLTLEPVLAQQEGAKVTVPAGFDPSTIRLVGNVSGQPPFNGTLQHAGWKVKAINLPKPADGQDEMVLMPAEVELA